MTRIVSLTVTACALALFCASAVWAQEYEIRLSRPSRVGEKYRLSATGSLSEKTAAYRGEKVVQNRSEEFQLELVSEVTVLEVAANGGATRKSLVIEKCLITRAGETLSPLARGTVILAEVENGKTVFKIKGTPVDQPIQQALSLAITLDTGGPTDDAVFGTREKKKVGESWAINPESAIESLKSSIQIKSKNDLTGSATLENVVKEGDDTFLLVKASFTVNNFTLPAPEEFKVQKNQLKASLSGKFPVDPSGRRFENSQRSSMSFTATTPPDFLNQSPAKIQGSVENQLSYRIEYLK